MNMFSTVFRNSALKILDLGLADYRRVLEQQEDLQGRRKAGTQPDTVLIVEHPPVITLGARSSANQLLVSEEILRRDNIELVAVRRGGGGTAHNPSQLVCYPILHLQSRQWSISDYIGVLETIGLHLLSELGVQAEQVSGKRGLWVGSRKIASIGVRISRSVTHHGMALNIQNDLRIFDYLVPCGLEDVIMTNVRQETGKTHDLGEVKKRLIRIIKEHLSPKDLPPTNNQ